jgi:hypothetical protein
MLQTTLFYKELLTFLRSVTITNQYFAQRSLEYDLLPGSDYASLVTAPVAPYRVYTPYYLHLAGHYILDSYVDNITPSQPNGETWYCYVNLKALSLDEAIIYTRGIGEIPGHYVKPSSVYATMDTMMMVPSEDVPGTTVAFTRMMLNNNVLTKARYRLQYHEYTTLCEKYPQNIDLIKSIVYPFNINFKDITTLPNYSLVGYAEDLLHSNEQSSLLTEVTSFLTMFRDRWDVKEYVYEALYPNVQWGALWIYLFQALVKVRIQNLRTYRVHPDHIWEYLASKGLDDYRSILTREQELFLYKNIDYLHANRGKHGTMMLLAENILGKRYSDLVTKDLALCPQNATETTLPIPEFIDDSISHPKTPSENAAIVYYSADDVLTRMQESGLIPATDDAKASETTALQYGRYTHFKTKLMEIKRSTVDFSFSNLYWKYTFSTLMNLLGDGKVNHQVNLVVDAGYIDLTTKEALALLLYCLYRLPNTDTYETFKTTKIPNSFLCPVVVNTNILDETTLASMCEAMNVEPLVIGEKMFTMNEVMDAATVIAESKLYRALFSLYKKINRDSKGNVTSIDDKLYSSVDDLRQATDDVFKILRAFEIDIVTTTDIQRKESLTHIYSQLVGNTTVSIPLIDGYTTFGDWFDSQQTLTDYMTSIESSPDRLSQLDTLATTLLNGLLGIESSECYPLNDAITTQYTLLKKLFVQLCSYNVAFMDTDMHVPTVISMGHWGAGTVDRAYTHTTYLPYTLNISPA